MTRPDFADIVAIIGLLLVGTPVLSQTHTPTEGPAVDGAPAWSLQGSFPDPGGQTLVDTDGNVTVVSRDEAGEYRTSASGTPRCHQSPICGKPDGRRPQDLKRGQWEQTLGYTFTYLNLLPPGFGGVPAVALDSIENLWAVQRAEADRPQLFKVAPDGTPLVEVRPDVISYQDKAHGMAVIQTTTSGLQPQTDPR